MKRRMTGGATSLVLLAMAATSLAGCAGGSTNGGSNAGASGGKVTITIGDRPTTSQKALRQNYDARVAAFEKANPNITLEPKTTMWDTTSFQAMVAGGTLPDVLNVPFTEPQKMIANRQIADLTQALDVTGVGKELNPSTLKIGQDSSGKIYAVPTGAYAIGLVYNRGLFSKAGLDPNKPPTTWDEVRADAKIIKQKTGVAGFGQMSSQNFGGWMLAASTVSYGGSLENAAGTKATFDSAPTVQALQLLHDMRWVDDSVDHNALYNYDTGNKAFAAGQFAMFVAPPAFYGQIVTTDGMKPADFGAGAMPQANGANATLSGGSVQIVSPKTTEAQREAAVKWINFFYLQPYTSQSAAVAAAKAAAASNRPVGVPDLSVLTTEQYDQYQKWIAPYVNVPLSHWSPFVSGTAGMKIATEPVQNSQKVYAALDTVIQTVLTNKSTDIHAVLAKSAANVDQLLNR